MRNAGRPRRRDQNRGNAVAVDEPVSSHRLELDEQRSLRPPFRRIGRATGLGGPNGNSQVSRNIGLRFAFVPAPHPIVGVVHKNARIGKMEVGAFLTVRDLQFAPVI
jgi:hypothetical protein